MSWDAHWLDAGFATGIKYMLPTFILGGCLHMLRENTSLPFQRYVILASNGCYD